MPQPIHQDDDVDQKHGEQDYLKRLLVVRSTAGSILLLVHQSIEVLYLRWVENVAVARIVLVFHEWRVKGALE